MTDRHTAKSMQTGHRQIVLAILGMHRSGTSLAANVARELGVMTGKELIVPDDYNQHGYAEDVQIVRLHDALLTALDRAWNTVKGTFPLPSDWTTRPEFETTREELASYLRSEFSRAGGRVWAVKDPRMSTLLPLWLQLEHDLDFQFLPVLCTRGPDAVAASIEKRDGIPADLGRLVWLQFNAAIVTEAGHRIEAVLNYDDWFTDPNTNLSRLASVLGREVHDAERSEILGKVVSSQLRHYTDSAPNGLFGIWHRLLEQWANEQKLPAQLSRAAEHMHTFLEAVAPWRRAIIDQKYLMSMIDARETERRELLKRAEENLKAYRAADAEFFAAMEANKRLERERDELHAVADRHLEAYRAVDALHIELTGRFANLARRFELVMKAFDRFPFSLFMPPDVRSPPSHASNADIRTDGK